MIPRSLFSLLVGAALIVSAQAEVKSYWSFNSHSPAPNLGSATLTATWFGLGPGTINYEALGSDLGALPGYDAGSALDFVSAATFLTTRHVLLENLNFAGMTGVEFSYAVASTELFDWNETAYAYYRIGDGEWSEEISLSLPIHDFTEEIFDFGAELDGKSNVSVLIEYKAAMAVGASLRIDNMKVSAVPEPSAFGLLAAGGLVMLAARRRAGRRAQVN